MTQRRWTLAAAAAVAAAVILAAALWFGLGRGERDADAGGVALDRQAPAATTPEPAGVTAEPGPAQAPAGSAAPGEAQEVLEPADAFDPFSAADESAGEGPFEIVEGVHSGLDPEYESVEVDGDRASYTHSAAGFRVDFPSRFNTSVPQVTGPIQGRFFLVSRSDELFPAMLYAAALEYTPPGGDAFAEEFERLTDEELGALGAEFLSGDQVPQAVRKVNHGGVLGIELVAEDPAQDLVQVTRIFFGDSHMVMVSGLVPTDRFDEQEPLVREYLDSLSWL